MTEDREGALLAELEQAENANPYSRPCQVCAALDQMSDQVKTSVEKALAGTIGKNKLAVILTRNGYPTGWRAVVRHRLEGHTS